ncbi:efflux RND transporter periplasmic adaptor subunit [Iodidimonas sp. SYSU 1G8]|uniref:efflux RND transporter periplasmic adaptor subunit n=1 Tax=Iodidimonas sp. SYSU 1G8 TaxID=3133967 RepID=UPI0031FE8C73
MNKSVVQSSRGKLIAAILAVLAIIAIAWWLLSGGEEAPPPPPPVPVSVMKAENRDVPHLASGIGTVESLANVTLRPQVEGVLAEVLFQEGQQVKKGQLLARIDDRPLAAALAQAQAEKARNEAQLRSAEQDLTRYTNLLKEEAISRQTVEQQEALVGQLRAAVRANDAAIAAAQVQMSFTRITSPVSGRIGLRRVDAGNLVRTSDTEGIVTVTQMAPISVVFSLPQTLVPQIQPLMNAEGGAPVIAFNRENGTRLAEGRMTMLDNQIDPTTGTIKLRAEFDNADGALWPGQFVTIQLRVGLTTGAVTVSPKAVKQGLDGSFVFRVTDGKAQVVPVTTGYASNDAIVITKGLAAGDTVVSDGQSRLRDGAPVRVAGAPKDGAAAVSEKTP